MRLANVVQEDVSELKNIAKRALSESVVLGASDLADLISHTSQNIKTFAEQADSIFLKSDIHECIVGYILLKNCWNLSDLFVLPEYQKQGLGSMMLSEAIKIARVKSNVNYILVNSSLNAEPFYRKYGFIDCQQGKTKTRYSVPLEYVF